MDAFDDVLDADGKVALGGQALVGGQYPPRFVFEQHAIGEGSAGVNAQDQARLGVSIQDATSLEPPSGEGPWEGDRSPLTPALSPPGKRELAKDIKVQLFVLVALVGQLADAL